MSSNPLLGEIMPVGFNFPPRGWALCDGQLLPISSNTALFSLLGTTFGGDGRTTFALPDLRSRSMVHVGSGAGLDTIIWGERGGSYQVQLQVSTMPSHSHTGTMLVENVGASDINGEGKYLGNAAANIYVDPAGRDDKNMAAGILAIDNTGGGQPFNNRNPFLGIYHCIALEGIYPSRS